MPQTYRASRASRKEPDGSLSATLQDQTSPVIIAKFSMLENSTTITVAAVIGARTITVDNTTGISAGKYLTLFNVEDKRFTLFYVVGAPAGNVVTLDNLIDFAYPIGSIVDVGITNMAGQNGSVTPVIFGLRNNITPLPPGLILEFDITRIVFKALTAATPDLGDFVDITALTNGLLFRRVDGTYRNIFNFKSNHELAGKAFDWEPLSGFGAGQDGYVSRLTFGGQSKMGVVVRIGSGEDAQFVIQDSYAGMGIFEIEAEGHIVQD